MLRRNNRISVNVRTFYKLPRRAMARHFPYTYIHPSKSVAPSASLFTGLENRNGELFSHSTRVPSLPLKDALQKFLEFLIFSSKPSLLVAHNARFDTMLLLQGIKRMSMIADFRPSGLSDSLFLLKKQIPNRKGKGQFQLLTLAMDLLNKNSDEQLHEASYDVKVLEELVCNFISPTELCQYSKSYTKALNEDRETQNTTTMAVTLEPLNGTISDGMMKENCICWTRVLWFGWSISARRLRRTETIIVGETRER